MLGSGETMKKRTLELPEKGARGDAVVKKVLAATREELAHVGYRALRVDDVAARADVHKTTVYRRWPTKRELVHEAMLTLVSDSLPSPDTGSLRGDLLEASRQLTQFMMSVAGQGVMRVVMAEVTDPDVVQICQAIRDSKENAYRSMVGRALERGELRDDVDVDMLRGMLFGPIHHRFFMLNQRVDELFLARLVDTVLLGAAPRPEPKVRNESSRTKTGR
jgi:AcrR family transcriptional regulator